MDVSENSVPLKPMVNDHYPYEMAIIENIPYFQTNPYGLTWNLPPNSRKKITQDSWLQGSQDLTSRVCPWKCCLRHIFQMGHLMGNMMIAAIADELTLTLPSWRASVRKARKSVLTHWLCGKVNPSKLRICCMKIWNLATNIWGVLKRGDPQNHRCQY